MSRTLLLLMAVVTLASGTYGCVRWRSARMFPPVSNERVTLSSDMRTQLLELRRERKFQPNDYPPLGYTGTESPDEEAEAVSAVDRVIDGVLSSPEGLVTARRASDLIGRSMRAVDALPTEDRDRTAGYMLEVWYILGFRGATGQFAYGEGYSRPAGYAEPLPSGWTSPTQPRPIG